MITDKVKRFIFKKLYNDLKGVEIIPYKNSLFFVDRENKYWYLEFDNVGNLYWRYEFFDSFFSLFSMRYKEYEKVISEWMEEVLNCKVSTTSFLNSVCFTEMEEVLNHKVNKTVFASWSTIVEMDDVLNHKVNTSIASISSMSDLLEKVLTNEDGGNDYVYPHLHKVNKTEFFFTENNITVEEILNHKVNTSIANISSMSDRVEKVLTTESILKVTN